MVQINRQNNLELLSDLLVLSKFIQKIVFITPFGDKLWKIITRSSSP